MKNTRERHLFCYKDILSIILFYLDILSTIQLACTSKSIRSLVKCLFRPNVNRYSIQLSSFNGSVTTTGGAYIQHAETLMSPKIEYLFVVGRAPDFPLPLNLQKLKIVDKPAFHDIILRDKISLQNTHVTGILDADYLYKLNGLRFLTITINSFDRVTFPVIPTLEELSCEFFNARHISFYAGQQLRKLDLSVCYSHCTIDVFQLSSTTTEIWLSNVHLLSSQDLVYAENLKLDSVTFEEKLPFVLPHCHTLTFGSDDWPEYIPNLRVLDVLYSRRNLPPATYPITTLRGCVPASIFLLYLDRLQHLDCYVHQPEVLSSFCNLKSLLTLELSVHFEEELTQPVVQDLPNLTDLTFSGNHLWIENLPKLIRLSVQSTTARLVRCPTTYERLEYVDSLLAHIPAKHHVQNLCGSEVASPLMAFAEELTCCSIYGSVLLNHPVQVSRLNVNARTLEVKVPQPCVTQLDISISLPTLIYKDKYFPNLRLVKARNQTLLTISGANPQLVHQSFDGSEVCFT